VSGFGRTSYRHNPCWGLSWPSVQLLCPSGIPRLTSEAHFNPTVPPKDDASRKVVRMYRQEARLLQVSSQDLDKPLGGARAVGAWLGVRAENVVAELALHEFAHQTVDGAAAGGNLL
jgi:hypothetical protein